MGVYAVIKFQILFGYENYKVQTRLFEEEYVDTDRFTHLDGFAVAAGIISGAYGQDYNSVPANVGAIKFYHKTWSPVNNINFEEIPTRKCERKDFNFGDGSDTSDALFYKTEMSIDGLQTHWENFLCPVDKN